MKHISSEYPFPKCLGCGGLVISELQVEEERKKFIYENAASNNSLFPSANTPPKSTESHHGFSCRICGIFYIFPPPLDKERWDIVEKIFLNSLTRQNTEDNKPTEE